MLPVKPFPVSKYPTVILLACLFVTLSACQREPTDLTSFGSVVASAGGFGDVIVSLSEAELGETEDREGNELWTCTSKRISVKDALGGNSGFSLFSPGAGIIYPGNLLQGNSLRQSPPDNIPADRGGGDITISLLDGGDISGVSVDEITFLNVMSAANAILSTKDAASVIPANFEYERSIVQSERELALRLEADYENAWAEVSGSLSFSNNTTYSRMMVTLEQSFYQLAFSEPPSVDDFFSDEADPADLARFIGPGNPPCYISSVNYGRIFYMLIEASGSETELQAAVDAAFETPVAEGGGSVEVEEFNSFSEVNIKIFALGGDAATTLRTIDLGKNELNQLGSILEKATDIRTAQPISYVVKSLLTNEIVSVQLATEYDVKTCFVTSALPPPVRTEHWEGAATMLGAPIGALVQSPNPPFDPIVMIFDSLGTHFLYDDGETLTGPYGLDQFGDNFPLEDVGAGNISLLPPSGNISYNRKVTYLVNRRGNRAAVRGMSGNDWTASTPLSMIPPLDYWTTEGVGAMTEAEVGYVVFNKSGTGYTMEPFYGDPNIEVLFPAAVFTGGTDNKMPEGIAGISKIAPKLYATVSQHGNRYMVFDIEREVYYGPFKF